MRTKKLRIVGHGAILRLRMVGDWEGEPLEGVRECCRVTTAVDKALRQEVRLARQAGHSWTEIGQTFGVTKQAVWERFGKTTPCRRSPSIPDRSRSDHHNRVPVSRG